MGSVIMLSPYFLYAQNSKDEIIHYNGNSKFTLKVFASYVSSAELHNNIKSSISFIRDASIELNGGYGYGAEVTFNPGFSIFDVVFYFSSEYLKVKDDELILRFENDSAANVVRFTEEYKLIPLEGGIKWYLPVSTDRFKIFIGGGAGLYLGSRNRFVGPLYTTNLNKKSRLQHECSSRVRIFCRKELIS